MATEIPDRPDRVARPVRSAPATRAPGESPTRRTVLTRAAALAALPALGLAAPAVAQARARVVVVGGGVAGASVAGRLGGDPGLEVTLVNMEATHTTGSFSNLYLAGFRSLASISFRYDDLAARAGFRFAADRVVSVDRETKRVTLAGGAALDYDRLVLAPGVAFRDGDLVGYDVFARRLMPHAYLGGYQVFLLKRRLETLPDGGVVVITVPRPPYRGRLAPYERAGMIALALSRTNPRAKVLILDANDDFPMRELFLAQWSAFYGDRLEWLSAASTGGGLARVDAPNGALVTGDGTVVKVDAANVIPAQRAGAIALQANLADDDGWAAVEAATMRSLADPSVYVVGDAARVGPAPKTADAARAQAAAAAAALRADLAGGDAPGGEQATSEWAFLSHHAAVKAAGVYAVQGGRLASVSQIDTEAGADAETLRQNALDANVWYGLMTEAVFA